MLRAYLDAWFPILSRWQDRILFIDGFAGPGEYEGGEEGSPQIAMKALVDHSARIDAEVVFIFIEKDKDRAEHLGEIVDNWQPKLPKNSRTNVVVGQFDNEMDEVLER